MTHQKRIVIGSNEVHSDHCQISKMVLFRKTTDGFKSLFDSFSIAGLFENDSKRYSIMQYWTEESRLWQGQS